MGLRAGCCCGGGWSWDGEEDTGIEGFKVTLTSLPSFHRTSVNRVSTHGGGRDISRAGGPEITEGAG